MELQATMALDRDAVNTVALRLLPPSTAPTAASCWLLLHTIPITANLSRTLSRLVSIEEAAMSQSSLALMSPPAATATASWATRSADVPITRSSASRRSVEHPSASSSPSSSEPSSLNASFAQVQHSGWVELVRVGYVVSEIHAYCILLKCRSPSQAVRMKAALEEGAALGVTAPVEFVCDARRVTVTRRTFSETCAHDHEAQDEALSPSHPQNDGSLVNTGANEAMCDGATMDTPHARSTSPLPPTSSPLLLQREQQKQQQHGEHANEKESENGRVVVGRSNTEDATAHVQRWRTEVHAMPLFDAVTTIYPVRDGEGVENDGSGYSADNRIHDERHISDLRQSLREPPQHGGGSNNNSQHCHPQKLRRANSDQALSAPSSPSHYTRMSPTPSPAPTAGAGTPPMAGAGRARGGLTVSKGVAPPHPAHARHTPLTASRTSPLPHSPASHHAHTPLHLPSTCSGDVVSAPLRLDGTNWKSQTTDKKNSLHLSGGLLPTTAGGRRDEFCAICQVDPLRSGACVTTLCQHSFHLHCYSRLPSGSAECPLCRFSVYELLNDARCDVCGTYEDLWVCLICGHVACGRARRDHQQHHYSSSGHSCSWQSSTNRVWNLRSRMFLHQEVVLLLDGTDEAQSVSDGHSTYTSAAAGDGGPLDRLRHLSWAEPIDSELQEALNESKEEAVAHYYTEFLRQLTEEQRVYYEQRLAHQRSRRERRRWHAETLKEEKERRSVERHERRNHHTPQQQHHQLQEGGPLDLPLYASVHRIVREERRQRRHVLAEYAPATVKILQQAQREHTTVYNSLKSTRDDVQQQVLLRSHFNTGLVALMEEVRQRTHEAVKKGEKNVQARSAEEAVLQKKVEDALSALHP